jgi:hypothetical protein
MICSTSNLAQRRYVVRMWVAAALCILFSVVTALEFKRGHPTGVLTYLMAILPALPIIGALVGTGIYLLEEADEFQRNLLIQSLLGGMGAILSVATVWGNLEDFAHAPHLDLIWVYPMFWVFVGLSYGVVTLRYR